MNMSTLKLTQPHLFTNNMFPPINAHSRPPSEDLRGPSDVYSASKQQQQIRRQQTIDQQRRSPLRIIYRSTEYAWNEHPSNTNASNQPLRAASPLKTKMTTSARQLANGILHESPTGVGNSSSMLHLPSSNSPIVAHQQYPRDENNPNNNGEFFLSGSASKSRQPNRAQRNSSHLDKSAGPVSFGLPIRSESYRSSHMDYGLRARHTSSKQRSYVNSKASSHDMNGADYFPSNNQDETVHHSPTVSNSISNNQRLNVSSFDVTTSRKAFSPNKSISFNAAATSGATTTAHHMSGNELHRSDTNVDRNHLARFAIRGNVSKEHLITSKHRQTTTVPTAATIGMVNGMIPHTPAGTTTERHPSAQSYKSRDPNVSYAYNDVKKYIDENELMSAEKEQIIRNWILDVEKYRHQLQKIE